MGLLGSGEKQQLKNTLVQMGSQGEICLPKMLPFLDQIDDFHLNYCMPKKNTKTTTSGRS